MKPIGAQSEIVRSEADGAQSSARAARIRRASTWIAAWAAFAALMVWAWGPRDLLRTVSHYGDAFETLVTSRWFSDALASGRNPLVYPYNFAPEGWRIGTHSVGTLLYVMLVPLVRLSGEVFTYNFIMLLNCAVGFAGALLLARRYLTALPATVVALAIAFWSLRWNQAQDGRLQVFLASTALPWMLWGVDQALATQARARRLAWLAFAGACWAFAFNMTLYFVFIGGIMLAAWILPARGDPALPFKSRLAALAVAAIVMLLLGAPWLALNLRESAIAQPAFYSIEEVNLSGASLNSLPVPYLNHPWLGDLARRLYRGDAWEQGMANMGLVGSALAIGGIILARRRRGWLPALAVAAVGIVFALGLTAHWNGEPAQVALFRPLNSAIWQLGHLLKPGFFTTAVTPDPFADAVPLPSLLLATFLPFWERGRMFARYGLAANLGVLLLAGLALAEIGRLWPGRRGLGIAVQTLLAGLLLFEAVPPRLDALPFPPAGHEAFEWLSKQDLGEEAIINLFAAHESTAVLANHGYNLLAPAFHGQATVAGAAGVRPSHAEAINDWLATHQHPFWHPHFGRIMREYKVRYVVLEMKSEWEQGLWEEAQVADELSPVGCFPAPDAPGPWNWPICIAEVSPEPFPEFNVLLGEGWSGMEEWGVWAESADPAAQFILTRRGPARLEIGLFPLCVPGKPQRVAIEINGAEVASYLWPDCEPWKTTLTLPQEVLRVGFNDLVVRAAFAQRAVDAAADDPRRLSVGLTGLRITPAP